MGTRGRQLVGDNAEKLVDLLNRALADEWLAYYQYWIGAKVVRGPMKGETIAELTQHAADELRHAEMLATRIIQLGGTPILDPSRWKELTNCGYDAPTDPFVKTVLEQNIKGEQCAISTYSKILEFVKEFDPITEQIVVQILADEVEHEDDLQSILEDFEDMKFAQ